MTNKRELTGLSCEQEEKIAEKAPKKNKTAETSIQPSYVVKEKTHKEAGFYGGDMVRSFVPRNELGDEVDVFLYWVFVEEEEFNMASYPCDDVNIENARNDDVASFFVPLDQSYMGSLSFFQDGKSSFASCMAHGLKNKEGSAIEQMKAFAKWYASEDNHVYGHRLEKLDWLIKKLEAKSAKLGITSRS